MNYRSGDLDRLCDITVDMLDQNHPTPPNLIEGATPGISHPVNNNKHMHLTF